jgi:outer membrane protein assembly factor BamB
VKKAVVALLAVLLMVGCPKKNRAPEVPSVPSGPSVVATDSLAHFSSAATDPDGDSVSIRFDWGDAATSEWSNWVASGDTVTMSHLWADTGTFQLKTQAKDRQDLTSAWSAALAVSITPNRPPNTPAVPSGPSTAPKDSTCLFTTSATDTDGDSVSYRFDWGNGDTSGWTGWTQSGTPGGRMYAWRRSGTYPVRVQAKDAHEARSPWSNPHQAIIRNLPPNSPATPTGPPEGGRNASHSFSSSATDPGGDSVSIRYSWGDGDSSGWSGLVPSGQAVTIDHSWREYGTYHIQAQAKDEDGATSDWSLPMEFVVSRLKWRYETNSDVSSSPAIAADGTVYVGSDDDCLYALHPDGTTKWWYWTGGDVSSSPAVGADGTVCVGSEDGCQHALFPNGTLKWRDWPRGTFHTSPAIAADGTVYFGCDDSCLYALSPSGTQKWQYKTYSWILSDPAIAADGTVYLGSFDNFLRALYPNGTLRWFDCPGAGRFPPAIAADGTVIHATWNYVFAFYPDGTRRWQYNTGGSVLSSPAVAADGTIYVGVDSCLRALNPDGTFKWQHYIGSRVSSTPAIAADGTVYVGSDDGYLYALNADSTLKWRYQTGGTVSSSPAIAADGTVYVGSDDNYLYAIEGDSPLADAPWPKFHHDNKNTGRVGGGQR